jgi:DNA-binding LacI/PurR family transcriptional regulator
MATIKDVARDAGVSIATVSYVLNNKTDAVSAETRDRVLAAVKRLGYTRNITARNLRSSQSRLLGYAWIDTPDPRPNTILEHFAYHLAREAWACGYHLLTFTYPKDDPIPVYENLIRTGRVDAFIIASTEFDDPRIRYLLEERYPFAAFGRSAPQLNFNWVDTDGHHGVYQAVQHLAVLGHERIAIVTWPEDSLTGNIRLEGYLAALRDRNIPFNPACIIRTVYGEDVGADVFAHVEQMPVDEQPTAYITVSDMTAVSLIGEAERRGHVIGKTLSVVGFDDEPLSRYLHPPLTTIRQPIQKISHALIEMLEGILINPAAEPRHLLMPPELIVRESTGVYQP